MRLILILLAFLWVPSVVWGHGAPPVYTDGTTECRPAYTVQVQPGSLSCTTVQGVPSASFDPVGAPPGTTAWQNITAGANPNNLTMNGILSPGTGTIQANRMQSGDITLTAITNTGMTASGMYVGDAAAGSLKIALLTECTDPTPIIRWNTATRQWSCVAVPKTGTGGVMVSAAAAGAAGVCMEWDANGNAAAAASGQACGAGTGTANFADLQPGNNNNAGTFEFSGPALFRVSSQMRIPTSATDPAVDEELKIKTNGDGTAITEPQLTFRQGATVYRIPAPDAPPSTDGDVLTYLAGTNKTVWAQPPGAGTGSPPQGPENSVQTRNGANFRGSTRWLIDPADNDALKGTCNRGTLGDCAWDLTSETADVSAPAVTNSAKFYIKQTGTVYDLCVNGNGDSGPRCVSAGGMTLPRELEDWDMAGLSADGTTAASNWDYDSGTVTPTPETAWAIKFASLEFAEAGTSCVQRHVRFPTDIDLTQSFDAGLNYVTTAASGSVTFSVAMACWNPGAVGSTVAFNTATSVPDTTSGANARSGLNFIGIDKTGCTTSSVAFLRLCQTANTLGATARVYKFIYSYARTPGGGMGF